MYQINLINKRRNKKMNNSLKDLEIGVIGLGYVGLPLAVKFGKKIPNTRFRYQPVPRKNLLAGHDSTLEVSDEELKDEHFMSYSYTVDDLKSCYGDGGAVFTNNDEYAELLRSYRVHGKGQAKYDNVRICINR
jgi:hypothetical protein